MATCQQPGNKYDLEKVRDYPNEPLPDYICRFLEMLISIPNINSDEAISVFIRGLRHHDALRTKLLRKRPDSAQDLLTVVKKWVDADEADQQIKEDVGWAPRPD
jgi:LPS O-antigen subunit length determinant protein (WzzB/FepE family)